MEVKKKTKSHKTQQKHFWGDNKVRDQLQRLQKPQHGKDCTKIRLKEAEDLSVLCVFFLVCYVLLQDFCISQFAVHNTFICIKIIKFVSFTKHQPESPH